MEQTALARTLRFAAVVSQSAILTPALVAQWPRWRSERDVWRFARAHVRAYVPALGSQSQLNRRLRATDPALRALHAAWAPTLGATPSVYHVVEATLIAVMSVCACRHGLFAGQASFGRGVSKTDWV